MQHEKSCGAVVYKTNAGKTDYLIILNRKGNVKGHWGFPKGHVEDNETEVETAKREIFEEVGIKLEIDDKFKYVKNYMPKPNVEKEAVYFVAEVKNVNTVLQESEIADYKWCCYKEALDILTYDSDILEAANKYIMARKDI